MYILLTAFAKAAEIVKLLWQLLTRINDPRSDVRNYNIDTGRSEKKTITRQTVKRLSPFLLCGGGC